MIPLNKPLESSHKESDFQEIRRQELREFLHTPGCMLAELSTSGKTSISNERQRYRRAAAQVVFAEFQDGKLPTEMSDEVLRFHQRGDKLYVERLISAEDGEPA